MIEEVFIHDTYKIREIKEAPEIVFDIGGHIGSFTIALKSRFPKAKVWIVEPHPRSIDLIRKNTAALSDVTLIEGAISYSGGGRLADGKGTTGGGYITSAEEFEARDDSRYELLDTVIPSFTVEDVLERAGVDRVDLVKWDCEGGEIDAFANMSDEAAGAFGNMVGEFHHQEGYEGFAELARKRFPRHRFEGRPHEIEDRRKVGWFRAFPE